MTNYSKKLGLMLVTLIAFATSVSVMGSGVSKQQTQKLRKIQKKFSEKKQLHVQFEQILYKSLRKSTTKSRGEAFFSTGKIDQFHWKLTSPSQIEWIYNGRSLYNYNPKERSAIKYDERLSKGREIRQIIDMVLKFDTLLNFYQLIGYKEVSSKALELQLKPKRKSDLRKVSLSLDLSKAYISKIVLLFQQKNSTTFRFSNPVWNTVKPQQFSLPIGTKISGAQ